MSENRQNSDQRKGHRHEGVYAEYAVLEKRRDIKQASFQTCFLRNFSMGGAGLLINERVEGGVLIAVRLYEPRSPNPVEVIGQLAWQKKSEIGPPSRKDKYNIGIKFLKIDRNTVKRLKEIDQYFITMKDRPPTITEIIDENR